MDNQELVRYKDEYNKLMSKWAEEGAQWYHSLGFTEIPNFYMDGVLDLKTWQKETKRLLFVLKEPHEKSANDVNKDDKNSYVSYDISYDNGDNGKYGIVNFVSFKSNNSDPWPGNGFWKRIPAVAQCILDNQGLDEAIENMSDKYKRWEYLERIAVVNLKKYPGGETVCSGKSMDNGHYLLHAGKDFLKLKKQIAGLKPNVIVCCGESVDSVVRLIMGEEAKIVSIHHPSFSGFTTKKTTDGIDAARKLVN